MSEQNRIIDEFASLISLSAEETRIIQLLIREVKLLSAKEIGKRYTKEYGLKVGNKIYYLLNTLQAKDLVTSIVKKGTKYFTCAPPQLRATVYRLLREEHEKKLEVFDHLKDIVGKPAMEKCSGKQKIIQGFAEMEETLLQRGGKMLDVRDVLPFVADTVKNLKLRHQDLRNSGIVNEIEKDVFRLTRRHELLKRGLLSMTMVLDKEQTLEYLQQRTKDFGLEYALQRLRKFLDLLKLPNFQVVFSVSKVNFMVEIIPNYAIALYWRSIPRGQTDRLLLLWHPGIVVGLEDYFWNEYNKALKGRKEDLAKAEVVNWTESLIISLKRRDTSRIGVS